MGSFFWVESMLGFGNETDRVFGPHLTHVFGAHQEWYGALAKEIFNPNYATRRPDIFLLLEEIANNRLGRKAPCE